jgi:hypothetical protein
MVEVGAEKGGAKPEARDLKAERQNFGSEWQPRRDCRLYEVE